MTPTGNFSLCIVTEECSKVFNHLGSNVLYVKILSLSGPKALVGLPLLIPLGTWSVVNVSADVNDFRLIYLDTSQVSREEVDPPNFDMVNCLVK